MSKTPSTMSALGTLAPDFSLPEPATGNTVSLEDFAESPALLVVFLSNHCPFVKHLADDFAVFADVENYPADSPSKMADEVDTRGYTFPYLFDGSQKVAKDYEAACTPDFFLYDRDRKLVYRGQFDPSRPSLDTPVTGSDLRAACDALLAGVALADVQVPSVGCNIKWKADNAPPWFG